MIEDGSSRAEGVQYANGKQQRAITNSSRKNEEAGPKRKWCSIVDMSSGEGIGRRIGTWNVRSICRCSIKGHVWLFATPWTANCQTSLSFTISLSLLKLMSIELVMPSNHLILYHPLLLPSKFPSIKSFPVSWLFALGGQSIGASASASASVLPMNIQGWFPLRLTTLISLGPWIKVNWMGSSRRWQGWMPAS